MAARRPFKFGTDVWDPTHRFETSWLLSPWALFFCRALMSLYAFTTLIFVAAWHCAHGACIEARANFSYFTTLTYWGLAFYTLAAAVHTFTYARSGVPLLARLPRPLQALHSFFYTTVVVYPFIVTIVYWVVIYTGPWFPEAFAGWSNVSQHALNSAFALFELVVPRTDLPDLVHMLWLIVLMALYLSLAYVTKATKGFYTYAFLDPEVQGSMVAAYVFGIAVGCLLFFGLAWGAIWLRKYVTETRLGKKGKFATRDHRYAVPTDMEMAKPESRGH